MPEYGFSLTRIFPYKDKTVDSVLIREIRITSNSYSGMFFVVKDNVSIDTALFERLLLQKLYLNLKYEIILFEKC